MIAQATTSVPPATPAENRPAEPASRLWGGLIPLLVIILLVIIVARRRRRAAEAAASEDQPRPPSDSTDAH
jgi:hypothetical protein